MERRTFIKAMAAAVAFPFSFLRSPAQAAVDPRLIRTGWPTFDAALNGGFEPGNFVVLMHEGDYFPLAFSHHLSKVNNGRSLFWEADPADEPTDKFNSFPTRAYKVAHWYRVNHHKIPADKVVVSPHELKPMSESLKKNCTVVPIRGPQTAWYFAHAVVRVRMVDWNVVEYSLRKNMRGQTFPTIRVLHHPFRVAEEIEVVNVGTSSG